MPALGTCLLTQFTNSPMRRQCVFWTCLDKQSCVPGRPRHLQNTPRSATPKKKNLWWGGGPADTFFSFLPKVGLQEGSHFRPPTA